MTQTPNQLKFYKEFLELAQKHKVNIEATVDFNYTANIVQVVINGAWEIRKDFEQLEVYEILPAETVHTIYGTKK